MTVSIAEKDNQETMGDLQYTPLFPFTSSASQPLIKQASEML